MSLTTLDAKTALIVIDLQKGIVALPPAELSAPVIKQACVLVAAFRSHNLPVVLVNVNGGAPGRTEQSRGQRAHEPGWDELIPELNQQPTDHQVTKRTWGAFAHTELDAYLRDRGVTQVVIAGVATSIGVESTARQAYELGYNVTLAIDAMADLSPDTHLNSITRIFPKLGETGSTQDIIRLLENRGQ